MFTQLAAGTQLGRAKLYGIEHDGRIFAELFDAAGNIQSGFALTAPGLFFDVAVAEQF